MSSAANTVSLPADNTAPIARPTQPFFWSVRREIWEHKAIWRAPLIAAALVIVGFLLRVLKLPALMEQLKHLPPLEQGAAVAIPFAIAAVAILATTAIVSVFYCLSALNTERRDRSILFWKSLPVSDTTTVLSKVFIPFVVLPVVALATIVATELVMLAIGSLMLAINGISLSLLFGNLPLLQLTVLLVYLMAVSLLWQAPIYGWLLMVSSWARRVAFLWAVLPWVGLVIFENIAFDSERVADFIQYRLNGQMEAAFTVPPALQHVHGHVHLSEMEASSTMHLQSLDLFAFMAPGQFLATPGLWLGLIAAAAFVTAAIWFRRMRDPG